MRLKMLNMSWNQSIHLYLFRATKKTEIIAFVVIMISVRRLCSFAFALIFASGSSVGKEEGSQARLQTLWALTSMPENVVWSINERGCDHLLILLHITDNSTKPLVFDLTLLHMYSYLCDVYFWLWSLQSVSNELGQQKTAYMHLV